MEHIEANVSKELDHFIKTLPQEKRGSNVYEIICEDMDGNITERKFGVNVMTNSGFAFEFRDNSYEYDSERKIFIGTGTGTPAITDTQLFQIVPNSIPFYEAVTDARSNIYDNTYDSVSGMIIGRRKTGTITMDYNYSWATDNINITEFGEAFGGDIYSYTLHTHCLIYDENHQPSYFTKRINEKVTISIYRSQCISVALINSLWTQGKYLFMDVARTVRGHARNNWDMIRFGSIFPGRCRVENDFPLFPGAYNNQYSTDMCGEPLMGGMNNGFEGYNTGVAAHIVEIDGNAGYSTQHADGYRSNITIPEYVLQDASYENYGISIFSTGTLRSYSYSTLVSTKNWFYQFWYKYNNLTNPETITYNFCYTDDFYHFSFNNIFDMYQLSRWAVFYAKTSVPVHDFHITSCKRYNALTDEYDIVESFTDDPDYDFRNPERGIWGIYYCRDFTGPTGSHEYSVFINSNPAAMISFLDPSTYSIYLTDAYWDPSTFVKLDDNRTVPQELQHKKYIIKAPYTSGISGADGIHALREKNLHALVPTAPTRLNVTLPMSNSGCNEISAYGCDEGWIYHNNTIIYPESDNAGSPYVYTLSIGSYDARYIKFFDNHIVFWDNRQYIRPEDSTNTRIKIITLDSTHPDVDPNTTVRYLYDSEIKSFFGEAYQSNEYFDDYARFITDTERNQLLILRGTHAVGSIDVTAATATIRALPNTDDFTAVRSSLMYDSDYLVSFIRQTDTDYEFKIYDMVNEVVERTFTIPLEGTMSLRGILAYSTMVYIQINRDNTTEYIYMYNMTDGSITPQANVVWYHLIEFNSHYRLNLFDNDFDFDDEAFIEACHNADLSDDDGCKMFMIFKNDLTNPCYFDIYNNFPSWQKHSECFMVWTYGKPELRKLNGGKDYVLLIKSRLPQYSDAHGSTSPTAYNIIDVGYIRNKGYRTPAQLRGNVPLPTFRMPNASPASEGANTADPNVVFPYQRVSSSICWYSYATIYKNNVYVATTFDQPMLMDIASFLPHQLTGTTKTIQAINNPKKMSAHSHGLVVTNDI